MVHVGCGICGIMVLFSIVGILIVITGNPSQGTRDISSGFAVFLIILAFVSVGIIIYRITIDYRMYQSVATNKEKNIKKLIRLTIWL